MGFRISAFCKAHMQVWYTWSYVSIFAKFSWKEEKESCRVAVKGRVTIETWSTPFPSPIPSFHPYSNRQARLPRRLQGMPGECVCECVRARLRESLWACVCVSGGDWDKLEMVPHWKGSSWLLIHKAGWIVIQLNVLRDAFGISVTTIISHRLSNSIHLTTSCKLSVLLSSDYYCRTVFSHFFTTWKIYILKTSHSAEKCK